MMIVIEKNTNSLSLTFFSTLACLWPSPPGNLFECSVLSLTFPEQTYVFPIPNVVRGALFITMRLAQG